jgi:hypothetical protein
LAPSLGRSSQVVGCLLLAIVAVSPSAANTFGSCIDGQGNVVTPCPICQNHLIYNLIDQAYVPQSFKEAMIKIRINEVHSTTNPVAINETDQYFRFLFNGFDLFTAAETRGKAGFNFRMHAAAGFDAIDGECDGTLSWFPKSSVSFAYYADTQLGNLTYGTRLPAGHENWNIDYLVDPGADAINTAFWSSIEGLTVPTFRGGLLHSGDWFRPGDTVIVHVKRIGRDEHGMVPFDASRDPFTYYDSLACSTRTFDSGEYYEWAAFLTVKRGIRFLARDRWFGSYLIPVSFGTRIRPGGTVFEIFDEDMEGLANAPLSYDFLYYKGIQEDDTIVDLQRGVLFSWIEGGCFTNKQDAISAGDQRYGYVSLGRGYGVRVGHPGDETLVKGGTINPDWVYSGIPTSWVNEPNSTLARDGIDYYGKDRRRPRSH